jgi:predicted nucleic acid-binding protein
MGLLLDTNTLSYLIRGRQPVLDRFEESVRQGNTFLLSSVAHYELQRYLDLKGSSRLSGRYETLVARWQRCNLLFEDWNQAALLWAERHRAGRSIADLDLLLAVLALKHDAVLVTSNTRHFEGLNISLIDWTQV